MLCGVTVLFNPDGDVLKNIDSYIEYVDWMIVFDNSQKKNEHIAVWCESKSGIKYIFNGENLGISRCLNMASEMAISHGFKWLLTMDQDSYFCEREIQKFVRKIDYLDTARVSLVSPFHVTKIAPLQGKGYKNVSYTMTSGSLVNLDIYKKISGFDDNLFIDGVDWDYCLKSRMNGYSVLVDQECKLFHNLGNIYFYKIFGISIPSQGYKGVRRYYIARNKLYLAKKYYRRFTWLSIRWIATLVVDLLVVLLFEDQKIEKLRGTFKGGCDFIRGKTGPIC